MLLNGKNGVLYIVVTNQLTLHNNSFSFTYFAFSTHGPLLLCFSVYQSIRLTSIICGDQQDMK